MLKTTWRECDMRKLEGENFRSILPVITETVIKKPFWNIFCTLLRSLPRSNERRLLEFQQKYWRELRVVLHSKFISALFWTRARVFVFSCCMTSPDLSFIFIHFLLAVLPALVPTGFEDNIWFVGELVIHWSLPSQLHETAWSVRRRLMMIRLSW